MSGTVYTTWRALLFLKLIYLNRRKLQVSKLFSVNFCCCNYLSLVSFTNGNPEFFLFVFCFFHQNIFSMFQRVQPRPINFWELLAEAITIITTMWIKLRVRSTYREAWLSTKMITLLLRPSQRKWATLLRIRSPKPHHIRHQSKNDPADANLNRAQQPCHPFCHDPTSCRSFTEKKIAKEW